MVSFYLSPYARPIIPALQRQFAEWIRAKGGEADNNLGKSIHHLLIISYVFFGDNDAIFARTHLELRGTLLKMERDHDNGKDMVSAMLANERQLPDGGDGFVVSSFTPYMAALTLYLDFLKSTQPKQNAFMV